jgi:hypothetical protein
VPLAVDIIGVPIGAAKSVPLCGRTLLPYKAILLLRLYLDEILPNLIGDCKNAFLRFFPS